MNRYIDEHRRRFGVEPICRALAVAPSTYYAAKARPPSAREVEDGVLLDVIGRVHRATFGVYGIRKVWRQLHREGIQVGRDRVGRPMGGLGLCGATRTRRIRTTIPAVVGGRPDDLVERLFSVPAPDRLWVGGPHVCLDRLGLLLGRLRHRRFSRRIVGWLVSPSLRTDLALDAPEMAICGRGGRDLAALVHHSDRGTQYLAIRYSERLGEAGVVASVGSRGDSYDNALAETATGLYKA